MCGPSNDLISLSCAPSEEVAVRVSLFHVQKAVGDNVSATAPVTHDGVCTMFCAVTGSAIPIPVNHRVVVVNVLVGSSQSLNGNPLIVLDLDVFSDAVIAACIAVAMVLIVVLVVFGNSN